MPKLISSYIKCTFVLLLGLSLWFSPAPEGLADNPKAWQLFSIFFTTIVSIIIGAMPIIYSAVIALVITLLTGLLTFQQAFSGFAQDFILLIVIAFLVSRAVVASGLGQRLVLHVITRFGRSSLGLGYAMFITDIIIAPAFPSNTARSAVLYPITLSLALDNESNAHDNSRKRLGNYLMMNTIAGLSISSGLWLTAMAANPIGVSLAAEMGINISFFFWLQAAIVPSLIAIALLPWLLYVIISPEVKSTPEAPMRARNMLKQKGGLSKLELRTITAFISMILLWSLSTIINIPITVIGIAGIGILLTTGVFNKSEVKGQASSFLTFIWFAILYTLSTYLTVFGFTDYFGELMSAYVQGYSWFTVYFFLIVSYVLIHYFFVSQTAQLLALFSVFLQVGINAGVPGELLALMLLFATNFNSVITPQGSSANILSVGSGYLTTLEVYKYGGIVTLVNTFIFMIFGTTWILYLL